MGIAIPLLVDATTMDAAAINTKFTTVRDWQNGQILDSDVTANSVESRSVLRLEHYGFPQRRAKGPTGSTVGDTATSNPLERTYVTVDSHGRAVWADISVLYKKVYADDAGYIEACFEWWCWAIQGTAIIAPEQVASCVFRMVVNGTAVSATQITLYAAGVDTTVTAGGVFCYPARNFQAITASSVSAGWVNVKIQMNVTTQAARDLYSNIIIGARNMHLEYWRR